MLNELTFQVLPLTAGLLLSLVLLRALRSATLLRALRSATLLRASAH